MGSVGLRVPGKAEKDGLRDAEVESTPDVAPAGHVTCHAADTPAVFIRKNSYVAYYVIT